MKGLLLDGEDPTEVTNDTSQILTNSYVVKWFSTLYVNCLPHETTHQIWDAFLCDGIEILHRIALVIFLHFQGEKPLLFLTAP